MSIGTPYRKRRSPVESLLPKVLYMHYMDNTEGIPGNRPLIAYTTNKSNPFGRPGVDYSAEYPWRYVRMMPAAQAPATQKEGN